MPVARLWKLLGNSTGSGWSPDEPADLLIRDLRAFNLRREEGGGGGGKNVCEYRAQYGLMRERDSRRQERVSVDCSQQRGRGEMREGEFVSAQNSKEGKLSGRGGGMGERRRTFADGEVQAEEDEVRGHH